MPRHYSKPKAKPEHYHALQSVVTLAGAARMVYRSPQQVRVAIDSGRIAARKVGRVWLVSIDSLIEAYPDTKPRLSQ